MAASPASVSRSRCLLLRRKYLECVARGEMAEALQVRRGWGAMRRHGGAPKGSSVQRVGTQLSGLPPVPRSCLPQVLRQELQPLLSQQSVLHNLAALLLQPSAPGLGPASPASNGSASPGGAAGGVSLATLEEGRAALLDELQVCSSPSGPVRVGQHRRAAAVGHAFRATKSKERRVALLCRALPCCAGLACSQPAPP